MTDVTINVTSGAATLGRIAGQRFDLITGPTVDPVTARSCDLTTDQTTDQTIAQTIAAMPAAATTASNRA